MLDLIIIGAGPAGISAAIYAARKKLTTLIITKDFFGQVSHAFFIENYLGFKKIKGMDLIKKFKNHLERFEVDINQGETVINLKKKKNFFEVLTSEGDRYQAKTIIIGHEHPAVGLREGTRKETYKCFLKGKFKDKTLIVQPSSNLITMGTNILSKKLLSPFLKQDLSDFEVYVVSDEIMKFGKIKNLL